MDLGSEHERHLAEKAWFRSRHWKNLLVARSSRSRPSCTTTPRLGGQEVRCHEPMILGAVAQDIKAFYMRLNEVGSLSAIQHGNCMLRPQAEGSVLALGKLSTWPLAFAQMDKLASRSRISHILSAVQDNKTVAAMDVLAPAIGEVPSPPTEAAHLLPSPQTIQNYFMSLHSSRGPGNWRIPTRREAMH